MRFLSVHSDFLEFEPKKKAFKGAEKIAEKQKEKIEECLVVFTSVEKGDDESVVPKYLTEIEKISSQVNTKKIVLYPWVHLSSNPSKPETALEILKKAEQELRAKGYEVIRAPFGWYKAFTISCKGHPLSELSRQISTEKKENKTQSYDYEKLLKTISKAILSKEKLKPNDHRIIGQKLDLFSFYNVAPGMVFWHPKGLIIRNKLIEFWREKHRQAGYKEILTPQVMSDVLWKTSGHWEHYKDNIFTTNYEDRNFAVKPMNCPGGILVYKSRTRSYKDLPLRMSELGVVHRVELSGVLSGLFRLIQFTQDDAHIYCTEAQLQEEIQRVLKLVEDIYFIFGFNYSMELSTKPDKAMGTEEEWDKAENALKQALEKTGKGYKINEGDGAFYGPKIDFHIKDSLGREWQLATLQLDFQMPQRFKLEYVGKDGEKHVPIMLHRTILGSIERFIGILLEHTNGNLPFWLAPVQVKVISFNESNREAVEKFTKQLFEKGFTAEKDVESNTVQMKIREAELQKVPYIVVIGSKEEESNTIAVREHGNNKIRYGVKPEDFFKELSQKNKPLK